jgi:PASTA domain
MRERRWAVLGALVATVAAVPAASAEANTVTVGSSLTASFTNQVPFSVPATVTNLSVPAPATATSPVDGTVISWRFIGAGGPLTPRVLRPVNGTTLTGAGSGTPQNATAPGVVSGPFPVDIPIKRGDFFGADGDSGTSLNTAPMTGAVSLYFAPALVNDGPEQNPTGTNPEEDALSATVRFCLVPKLKGLTGKAARQALQAADCMLGKITKVGKRRHRTKRIRSQSVKPGKSIPDTEAIDLTISRKRK